MSIIISSPNMIRFLVAIAISFQGFSSFILMLKRCSMIWLATTNDKEVVDINNSSAFLSQHAKLLNACTDVLK